jgi:regulator of protease activity HflC (stomatin/prohibitin superfamily)
VDPAGILLVVLMAIVAIVLFKTIRVVPQASVFVIERLGKYSRTLEPGIHLLVPVLDSVRTKTDIREQVVGFPPQAVITRDNLVVGIDSVIYYSITDPAAAQYKIENVVVAIEQLVVTTLRNVVGGMQLEEALTGRDHINERLATVLDEATGKWGVKVNRVEIRGIEPPPTIRDAMEQAMRADRGKRAAILTAEGQQQSVVLNAEAGKQSVVLNAEAERTATILRAEADKQSALLRAEGEAKAIAMVVQAIKEAGVDETVLAFQRQQLLPAHRGGRGEQGLVRAHRHRRGPGSARDRRRGQALTHVPSCWTPPRSLVHLPAGEEVRTQPWEVYGAPAAHPAVDGAGLPAGPCSRSAPGARSCVPRRLLAPGCRPGTGSAWRCCCASAASCWGCSSATACAWRPPAALSRPAGSAAAGGCSGRPTGGTRWSRLPATPRHVVRRAVAAVARRAGPAGAGPVGAAAWLVPPARTSPACCSAGTDRVGSRCPSSGGGTRARTSARPDMPFL